MFSSKPDVIAAMKKYVVVSLHTDGQGPRRDDFGALQRKLTNSSATPLYVLQDPFDDSILGIYDSNQAFQDDFAARIEKGARRFERNQRRRGPTVDATRK